ncbi:DUF916 domain-containing protein [Enterococcus ureasiticus]|uniref:Uncharacterized protein n=1 Tax=Enterococcus ureasiticus TaxID=903984 RepID=A0A1E5GA88_9ENTE|nr:DUF916 domain-containing protein [Enterococcus ureasiticus]OEG09515.1 hypothetical protein BCR21_14280 [Enterococcus ureasiticus]
MQVKIKIYPFILALFVFFFLFVPIEATAQSTQSSFSVIPHYPSQQAIDVNGYYDLNVKKGDELTLRFSLRNPSDKAIIITNTISPATTNKNGQIIYGPSKNSGRSSAKHNLAELIDGPTETNVPANATTDLVLRLKAPNDEFEGILLGGIEFEQKNEKSDTQIIQNIVAYDIPILLRQTTQEVPLSLAFDTLNSSKLSDKQLLTQTIYNSTPTLAKKGSIVTEIRKQNTTDILYKETNDDVNFAPNSSMDFDISVQDIPLSAGTYTAKTIVQFGDQKWETTDSFKLDTPVGRADTTSNIISNKNKNLIYPLIIIILIVIIAALLYKSRKTRT